MPKEEEWSVYFVGFSSSGWTDEAKKRAEEVVLKSGRERQKRNWRAAGIRLVDLAEMDGDFVRWTAEQRQRGAAALVLPGAVG